MRSSTILTVALVAVLSSAPARPAGAEQVIDFAKVLSQIFASHSFEFDDSTMTGTLRTTDSSLMLEVSKVAQLDFSGDTYVVFAVTFPELRESAIEKFIESGDLTKSLFKDLLAASPVGRPADTVTKVIDGEADAVHVRTLEIADLIGNGTNQISIETTNTYLVSAPNEVIQEKRYYLYTLPALDEIFAATTMRVIGNELTKEVTGAQQVRFSGDYAEGTRHIELYEVVGNTKREIPLKNGRFEYELPSPTKRDQEQLAKRNLLKKTLRIQVIDPAGVPIRDAIVTGRVSWVRSIDWAEKSEQISGHTDENGNFEVSTPDNVDITIMHEGFYTQRKAWSREHITGQRVAITLEPENEHVSMFVGSVRFTKDTDADRYAFGIQFLAEERAPNNKAMTDNIEGADVWVELYRTGPSYLEGDSSIRTHNNKVWRMKVTGRNGWEFLPETDKTSKMREAPEGDYVTELDHSFSDMPQGIYLKKVDDRRYGKLMLTVFDHSDFGKVYRYCSMSYNVQAEATGTRSLNHK